MTDPCRFALAKSSSNVEDETTFMIRFQKSETNGESMYCSKSKQDALFAHVVISLSHHIGVEKAEWCAAAAKCRQ
jgi:hypothetical protein